MPVKVIIPAFFRHLTSDESEILFSVPPGGLNLKHLFEELEKLHPGLQSGVFGRDGKPKRFAGLFVNSKPYQSLQGIYTCLVDNDVVELTSAVVQE